MGTKCGGCHLRYNWIYPMLGDAVFYCWGWVGGRATDVDRVFKIFWCQGWILLDVAFVIIVASVPSIPVSTLTMGLLTGYPSGFVAHTRL